ncbi:hypothetical protein LX32DRAFT_634758 [Colletotrichum zoysiae]|uniref:Uncharacterized protein n=1 Tax=Colletotrichum zoysiae TaxID=1216348 RepID=A0AAD9M5G6_9PEZI|nr:hypothetical protein LX32DRAFT_634758 [Colletotrichum zoysiae]
MDNSNLAILENNLDGGLDLAGHANVQDWQIRRGCFRVASRPIAVILPRRPR